MDKSIKNIISEAFNELYNEMVNEAPAAKLNKNEISERDRESIIAKAKQSGRGFSWDQAETADSQDNFNYIVDNLIADYNNENSPTRENSKRAIQNAFVPSRTGGNGGRPNKVYNSAGKSFITDPKLEDAASSAFEQVMMKDFDKLVKNYRMDGGFSAKVLSSLKNRISNYIVRGHGEGISSLDPMGGGRHTGAGISSMDVEKDDGHSFHDTFSGPGEKESSMDISKRDAQTNTQKRMLKALNDWILDKYEIGAINKRAYIAISEILNGTRPNLIPDTYPDMNWKGSGAPTTIFNNFKDGKLGAAASEYISNMFDINFNTSTLDHTALAQQSSQSSEFNPNATVHEVGSEEMLSILGQINNITKDLGFTADYKITTDIPNTENIIDWAKKHFKDEDKQPKEWDELSKEEKQLAADKAGWIKLGKVLDKLEAQGREEDADNLKWMVRGLNDAKKTDKSKGGYGTPRTYVHKGDEENEYSGMYEQVKKEDIEKLMERVFKRLSK